MFIVAQVMSSSGCLSIVARSELGSDLDCSVINSRSELGSDLDCYELRICFEIFEIFLKNYYYFKYIVARQFLENSYISSLYPNTLSLLWFFLVFIFLSYIAISPWVFIQSTCSFNTMILR